MIRLASFQRAVHEYAVERIFEQVFVHFRKSRDSRITRDFRSTASQPDAERVGLPIDSRDDYVTELVRLDREIVEITETNFYILQWCRRGMSRRKTRDFFTKYLSNLHSQRTSETDETRSSRGRDDWLGKKWRNLIAHSDTELVDNGKMASLSERSRIFYDWFLHLDPI